MSSAGAEQHRISAWRMLVIRQDLRSDTIDSAIFAKISDPGSIYSGGASVMADLLLLARVCLFQENTNPEG